MTGAETVERSKQLYERYLTPKLREVLGTMDQQEQDYFWAYLYLTAPTEVSRVVVDGIRADVESRVRPLPEEMRSATPFRYAEESISAHGVFSMRKHKWEEH